MPGIYKKNELKLKALKLKNPYVNIEELFGSPQARYQRGWQIQRNYNSSTLDLSPAHQSEYTGHYDNARNISEGYKTASSVVGGVAGNITKPLDVISKATGYAVPVIDATKAIPMVEMGANAGSAANAASEAADIARATASAGSNGISEAVSTVAKVGEGIGKVAGAAGATLSAVSLGMDIANAVKDKKVTFDNAMRMADDGTALVSSALGMIPGVGTALSLGLLGGEKVVTAIIKGAKAVKDKKKELGVKHLKPGLWLKTVMEASTPSWMNKDIGEAYREWKKNKPQRDAEKKAQKAQAKAEWKKMSAKEKAKKFFFG
jgi:hypothetical protein